MAIATYRKLISVALLCVLSSALVAQEATEPSTSSNSQASKEKGSSDGISIDRIRKSSSAIFDLLDGDGNGEVTIEELLQPSEKLSRNQAMRRSNAIRVGFPPTNARIDVFEASDTNGDGALSKTEFEERARSVRARSLELAFHSIDADENGRVDLSEFNSRVDRLAEWDKNEDGILGRSEVDRDFWREANRVPGYSRWMASSRWGPRMRSWRSRR